MDVQTVRRVAPLVFGAVVAITFFVAGDAFIMVAIIGGILLGLLYALTGRSIQRSAGSGRDRRRYRDRER